MLLQETFRKLHEMKLLGIAQGLQEQLQNPTSQDLAFEERIGLLVDHEHTHREARRLKRLLAKAKLRENACLENIDYRTARSLDKGLIASLALGTWIEQGSNLIITGPAGGGKTWIACALGNQMCRQGKSVIFQRLSLLLEEFGISHADGTFRQRLAQLAKVDLLILDDLGISTLSPINRSDLLEVIEQRTGRGATLITSQMPVEKWHDYLSGGNPTVADAILDRLVSGSYRIDIKGESMRKKNPTKN